jgi:inositol monophosphatase 3
MVCVAVKGVPVIGVIHYPFGEAKTYWAWVGTGTSTDLASSAHQNKV